MATVVISEGILLIASVLVAVSISGIVMTKIGVFESAFTATSNAQQDLMLTKIKVIYATNLDTQTVNVWIKNVGKKSIANLGVVDVYFGELGAVQRIPYNLGSSPEWVYNVIPSDNVWNVMETLQIDITDGSTLLVDTTYLVRISTPNGVIDEYIFTII